MREPMTGPPGMHAALTRHTGFLISRVGLVAQRRFAERMDTLGLTPRMWGALNVLDAEGAITQHALCRGVGMDPSSMVATLDELEAKGMVQRRQHPTDRRAHALHLTTKGRKTLLAGRELARISQEELLAPLSAHERDELHDLLLRVAMAGNGLSGSPEGPAS